MPKQLESRRSAEFCLRLFEAQKSWEGRHHRAFDQASLGKAIAEHLGLDRPYAQWKVSRWFIKQMPDLWEVEALAACLEVDLVWLAFGKGPPPHARAEVPVPSPPPS
jgi:hypothetical protein